MESDAIANTILRESKEPAEERERSKMAPKGYITYIPLIYRQAFMSGEIIEMKFYYAWRLKIGDTLKWLTEEHRGTVKVLGIKPRIKGQSGGYGTVYVLRRVKEEQGEV